MNREKIRDRKWYNNAVAACIAVAFYVLLTHLDVVGGAIGTFIGYFRAVILGAVLAYIMNPLANWFFAKVFRKVRSESARWTLSVTLAVAAALLSLLILIGMLIPQLVRSIAAFSSEYDRYAASLQTWINNGPLKTLIDSERLHVMSKNALSAVSAFVSENAGKILTNAAGAGKNVLSWALALILMVYFLSAKASLKAGLKHLLYTLLPQKRVEGFTVFLGRCDRILVSYLVDSLMESVIVGVLNAIFMAICRMPYIGLVSVVVGVTNIIPNFGPVIGGVIGAFVLLLVNPLDALIFVIFTCVLQFFDGYILKPKLFGGSLGVSGLLILVAGIVFGNIFGLLGVLLSIPAAAILSFVYQDYLLPAIDARSRRNKAQDGT